MISSDNRITREEMAKALKVSTTTIKRYIKNIDHLHFVGKGRHGHWEIDN